MIKELAKSSGSCSRMPKARVTTHGRADSSWKVFMRSRTLVCAITTVLIFSAVGGAAHAAVDTTAPTVSNVVIPTGSVGPQLSAGATIVDSESGVNKAYVYIDRPDGKNVAGIRMWDDGSNGDRVARDNNYSAASTLNLATASYLVSILTYDSKYNEVKRPVANLTVAGTVYNWTHLGVPSPTPTPTTALPVPSSSTVPGTDIAPPSVSDVVLPTSNGPNVRATATVRDPGSGVNKVYLYVDRPDGSNAVGLRMNDEGVAGDPRAGDASYTVDASINLSDGGYSVSILTYDSKYNQTKPLVGSLTISRGAYQWTTGNSSPSPSATPAPTPSSASPSPNPTNSTPTSAPTPGTNLLTNGSFEMGLTGWVTTGNVAEASSAYEGNRAVVLTPTATGDARVEQIVSGLKPKTLYTLAVRIKTSGTEPADVWASWGATGGPQLDKTGSAQSPTYAEQRFTFTMAANTSRAHIWAQAGRNHPAGPVWIDSMRLVEGTLPPPSPDPGQTFASPPVLPSLPGPGENLISNGDFAAGLDRWTSAQSGVSFDAGNPTAAVSSTTALTGRLVQDLPALLAPNSEYTLTGRARMTTGDATIGLTSTNTSVAATQTVTATNWTPFAIRLRTPATFVTAKIVAENWKGDTATMFIDDLSLRAVGGEWLDTPSPTPTPQPMLFDDFATNKISTADWLLANKAWGGDNGGVVPANVTVTNGQVRLAANGDRYSGDVTGLGGRKTRVGAAIVTRNYFASGRYEVRAKIPRVLGACTAFWSFHYLEYTPSQAAYWDEPNRIRNSEIDWEFPTAADDGSPNDQVSFDRARANSWGGKFGGEGGNVSLRPNIGQLVADGQFHTYTYEWHSGASGLAGSITWLIDGHEVARYTGSDYGQDNIPFRASRFWIGVWFPASGYRNMVGWAGNPDFDRTNLAIDWVRITPFNDANDQYQAETWPNGFFATPDQYPG